MKWHVASSRKSRKREAHLRQQNSDTTSDFISSSKKFMFILNIGSQAAELGCQKVTEDLIATVALEAEHY